MKICDKKHTEIVWSDGPCPMCEYLKEIETLEKKNEELLAL